MWCRGLGIRCYHCIGSSRCCCSGSVLGTGMTICCKHGQKKPQLNMCDRLTHPMHTVHTPGIPPLTILHSYTHTLHTFIPNTHATCIYISQTWAPYVPDQTNHTNCIYQAHTPNMHPKYASWGKKCILICIHTHKHTHTHSLSNFTLNLIDRIFSFKRHRASFFVFCFPFYSRTGRGTGKFPG